MSALLEGLVGDLVAAARDPDVPMHELGVLAQEIDGGVRADPSAAVVAAKALAPLFEDDGPALFLAAVLHAGWVERGADPHRAAPWVRRLPGWFEAAAAGAEDAQAALQELWRPAVAVLGAWPEMRDELAARTASARAELGQHAGVRWLTRLFEAAEARTVWVATPDLGTRALVKVRGIADVLQLSVLVNAAFVSGFEADAEAAVTCARGSGPQTVATQVVLPRVLTDIEGEVLPEGASLAALPQVEGAPFIAALLNPEPFVRPVGRTFATLTAEFEVVETRPLSDD